MTRRRIAVLFAAFALLAAAVLPACVSGICCKTSMKTSIHASMPCCKGGNSMAPREVKPVQPVPFAVLAPVPTATPIVATTIAAISTVVEIDSDVRREPAPAPYLLHAQFRI